MLGLVLDCSEFYDENMVMVFGYCYYSGGLIIGLNFDWSDENIYFESGFRFLIMCEREWLCCC